MNKSNPILPLLAAFLATPAFAGEAELTDIATGLNLRAEQGGYAAGIAACLLGKGDPDATRARFTAAGWTAEVDGEEGLIYLAAPTGDFGGMLAADGSFCEIASETIGTASVMDAVVPVLTATSASATTVTNDTGCTAFVPLQGVQVDVLSTGQDPVCDSADTSAVRVNFE